MDERKDKKESSEREEPCELDFSRADDVMIPGRDCTLTLADGNTLEMVWVEPGTFKMWHDDKSFRETPIQSVTLTDGYWLAKYPVTEKLGRALGAINEKEYKWLWMGDNFPVVYITWDEVVACCGNLNTLFADKLPRGYCFCPPTEAQWEFAAGGGVKVRRHEFFDSCTISKNEWQRKIEEVDEPESPTIYEIGLKKPNALGIFDMDGIKWEWCQDLYGLSSPGMEVAPHGMPTGASCLMQMMEWGSFNKTTDLNYLISRNNFYGERSYLCFRLAVIPAGKFIFDKTKCEVSSWDEFMEHLKGEQSSDAWRSVVKAWTDGTLLWWLKLREQKKASLVQGLDAVWELPVAKKHQEALATVLFDGNAWPDGIRAVMASDEKDRLLAEARKRKARFGENWTVMLPGGVALEMVWVEPGTFLRGENKHPVRLTKGYWIGKYMVTEEQWLSLGINREEDDEWNGDRFPITSLSWLEVVKYCWKLNELFEGEIPNGYCFTLPSSAQWEFAAHGGVKSRGYKYSGSNAVDDIAWNDVEDLPHEVGKKKPNELGIHDMTGDESEYCRGRFDINAKYPDELQVDPEDTFPDGFLVFRSGSFWYKEGGVRRYASPDEKNGFGDSKKGFRVAVTPKTNLTECMSSMARPKIYTFLFGRTKKKVQLWSMFEEHLNGEQGEEAWRSVLDAWLDGELLNWLEHQRPDVARSLEKLGEPGKQPVQWERQKALADVLFGESWPLGVLKAKETDEKKWNACEKATPGQDWTVMLQGVPLDMVWVEPGTFLMGREDGVYDEKPVHRVSLTKGYWLGKYPFTEKQRRSGVESKDIGYHGLSYMLPVKDISWYEAVDYCERLNSLFGDKLPSGYRFGLPTEAQWEFAARGGVKSRGYQFSGSDDIDEAGWHEGNSSYLLHDVGLKKPNELGLNDMSGNVYEWCQDYYGSYSGEDVIDPQGPSFGTYRVLRGGSWCNAACFSGVAYRSHRKPSCKRHCGFRVAIIPIL